MRGNLKFFHPNLPELGSVAVVLEADGAGLGEVGELGFVDDVLAVGVDAHVVASDRDQERIPFAEGVVGVFDGDAGTASGLGHFFIGAVAVDFAGAEFLAPDVGLAFGSAAEKDSGVAGVEVGTGFTLGGVVLFHEEVAVVEDDGRGLHVRLGGESPFAVEFEVAKGFFGPEGFVVEGFAGGLAVVVDDAVFENPVVFLTGFDVPGVEGIVFDEGLEAGGAELVGGHNADGVGGVGRNIYHEGHDEHEGRKEGRSHEGGRFLGA